MSLWHYVFMDLTKIKTVSVGDLVVYEFGQEPTNKEAIVSHGRIRYMGYCYEIEGDYAKIQNIAMMKVDDMELQWEPIPQDTMDPIQQEIIRDRNKIMAWVPTFHIFIPEADSKDLNLVNLSAIYNFDEAYIEKIKNNAWLDSMGGNISKEIH